MVRQSTTREYRAEIYKYLTEHKLSYREVGEHFNVSQFTVMAAVREAGIPPRSYGGKSYRQKYRLTKEQEQQLIAEYESGKTLEELEPIFNIPWTVLWKRLKKLGAKIRPAGFKKGEDHHNFNGGISISADGYIHEYVPFDDPLFVMTVKSETGKFGYALQHRLVMARSLGRPLEKHETVHHIDGNRQNNDISNLQLRNGRHGKGIVLCCLDCGSNDISPVKIAEVQK